MRLLRLMVLFVCATRCALAIPSSFSSPEEVLEHFDVYPGFLRPLDDAGNPVESSFEPTTSLAECASLCVKEPLCRSLDFALNFPTIGEGVCFLRTVDLAAGKLVRHSQLVHLEFASSVKDNIAAKHPQRDDQQQQQQQQQEPREPLDYAAMPFYYQNLSAGEIKERMLLLRDMLDQDSFVLGHCQRNASLCFFHYDGDAVATHELSIEDGLYVGPSGKRHKRIAKVLGEYLLNISGAPLLVGLSALPETLDPNAHKDKPSPQSPRVALDAHLETQFFSPRHAPLLSSNQHTVDRVETTVHGTNPNVNSNNVNNNNNHLETTKDTLPALSGQGTHVSACELPQIQVHRGGPRPTINPKALSVVRGFARDWPALSCWVFEGDETPSPSASQTKPALPTASKPDEVTAAVVRSTGTGTERTVRFRATANNHHILAEHSEIARDIRQPAWLPTSVLGQGPIPLWSPLAVTAGPAGSGRFWARNPFDSWRVETVVRGRVLVAVYDENTTDVPGAPSGNNTLMRAHLWLQNTLPALQSSRRPRLCALYPGDALVIPPRWWALWAFEDDTILVSDHRCTAHFNDKACIERLRREMVPTPKGNDFHNVLSYLLQRVPPSAHSDLAAPFLDVLGSLVPASPDKDLNYDTLRSFDMIMQHSAVNQTMDAKQFEVINEYVGCTNTIFNARVPRVAFQNLTKEIFEKYAHRRFPVQIRTGGLDAALGWRTDRWTTAYLTRRVGHIDVIVQRSRTNVFNYEAENDTPLPFKDFLRDVYDRPHEQQTTHLYMNLQSTDKSISTGNVYSPPLSQLLDDVPLPKLLRGKKLSNANMWIGHASEEGTTSLLHQDGRDNFYVLLRGRKRITLFSPADTYNLYIKPALIAVQPSGRISFAANLRGEGDNFSPVSWPSFNATLHPRAANAKPMVVDVEAGDMLFIPSGWWHQVVSYGRHMAINYWFEEPSEEHLRVLYARDRCNEYFNATEVFPL